MRRNPLQLISYIKTDRIEKWYLIPFDYWVMNHWGQYGIKWDLPDEEQAEKFLEIVSKFKVDLEELNEAREMNKENLISKALLEPRVYADFKKKIFFSFFGEYALEDSILKSWKGKYFDFRDLIPRENRY